MIRWHSGFNVITFTAKEYYGNSSKLTWARWFFCSLLMFRTCLVLILKRDHFNIKISIYYLLQWHFAYIIINISRKSLWLGTLQFAYHLPIIHFCLVTLLLCILYSNIIHLNSPEMTSVFGLVMCIYPFSGATLAFVACLCYWCVLIKFPMQFLCASLCG